MEQISMSNFMAASSTPILQRKALAQGFPLKKAGGVGGVDIVYEMFVARRSPRGGTYRVLQKPWGWGKFGVKIFFGLEGNYDVV